MFVMFDKPQLSHQGIHRCIPQEDCAKKQIPGLQHRNKQTIPLKISSTLINDQKNAFYSAQWVDSLLRGSGHARMRMGGRVGPHGPRSFNQDSQKMFMLL